jgi:SRSO17 transposase
VLFNGVEPETEVERKGCIAMTKSCSFPGCTKAHYSSNKCRAHYDQFRRHGELGPLRAPGRDLVVVTARVTPATAAALGPDRSARVREILERVTGTEERRG